MKEYDIGTGIRRIRKKHNLTQAQLAKALGVSAATIANYENNKTVPSIETVVKLASLFDITTDRVMGNDFRRGKKEIALVLQGIDLDQK